MVRLAENNLNKTQIILIDNEIHKIESTKIGMKYRFMARNNKEYPRLISYYRVEDED